MTSASDFSSEAAMSAESTGMDNASLPRVTLPGTQIATSRVGFGCVGLTSLNDRSAALRLLESAFDAGITHFDTARLYGSGQSEGILGEFLKGKRDRVTVMTKFGKEPPKVGSGGGGGGALKRSVKWAMARSGLIKKLVSGAANKATSKGQFDPVSAQRSLETSLRELGTDYVDFLMLHDCALEDTQRADTLGFLQQQVQRGTVRAFGATLGTAAITGRNADEIPVPHAAVMFPSSTVEPTIDGVTGLTGRAVFTCRPIKHARHLAESARKHSALAGPFAHRLGGDPTDPALIARHLLADSLARNPAGVVVFSTSKAARIAENLGGIVLAADQRAAFRELIAALAPHIIKT